MLGSQGKAQPSLLLPEPSLPRQGSFHYTVQSVGAIIIRLLFLLPSQVVQGRSTGWGFQAGSIECPETASKAEVFLKHGTSHLSPSSELAVAPTPEGASPLFWYLWTSGPLLHHGQQPLPPPRPLQVTRSKLSAAPFPHSLPVRLAGQISAAWTTMKWSSVSPRQGGVQGT